MALDNCADCKGILRVGLSGDHLRLITEQGLNARQVERKLKDIGLTVQAVQKGEPTLEDVFLSLAKG
jgi:hypothetical protein